MKRAEAQARAFAAVEAIIAKNTDPWTRFQEQEKKRRAKQALPGQIRRARARLQQLLWEAEALGVELDDCQ